ncbi:MAG: GerMN domain-containing protein [Acetivibrionales bacterium]|jgi:germination protein M
MKKFTNKGYAMKGYIIRRFAILLLTGLFVFSLSACSSAGVGAPQEDTRQEDAAREEDAAQHADEKPELPAEEPGEEKSSATNAKTVKVTLYFPTEDNSALKMEEREIQVVDGAILRACVLALAEGPAAEGLRNPIPEETELIDINIKDKVAIVDFSKEFLKTEGLSEITTRLSVVNTLTGINGVDKVRIRIEGKDMIGPSGLPLGDMEPALLNDDGTPVVYERKTVTLYFSDDEAMYLVGEERDIIVTEKEPIEELVIKELLKGPVSEHLWDTIPDGTRLISASTKDGICTVDFSSEYVDNSPGGTTSERMAIYSVVNTLTELEGIQKVQFLIEGRKREIYTHAIFDEPFSRDESILNTTSKAE